MEEARGVVEKEQKVQQEEELTTQPDSTPALSALIPEISKKKPWYKKWWVVGLGAGVVATGIAVAAGGGATTGTTETTPDLPAFPDRPGN